MACSDGDLLFGGRVMGMDPQRKQMNTPSFPLLVIDGGFSSVFCWDRRPCDSIRYVSVLERMDMARRRVS